MDKSKIIKYALLQALAAALYITLVALLLTNAQYLFGPAKGVLAAVAFLLTFVLSAAVMGLVIFGRPVLWYLAGSTGEAVSLALYPVSCLFLLTVAAFAVLLSPR